jgi:hypothetical protein
MDVGVVVVGLAVLLLLAVAVGLRKQDEGLARERAWREIAEERRRNWEERRHLEDLRTDLELCRDCPYRAHPDGRPDDAPLG